LVLLGDNNLFGHEYPQKGLLSKKRMVY
jgi:hypothetical protein